MAAKFLVIFAIAFFASTVSAEKGVPILFWKSQGSLPTVSDVSKSCTPANDDFKVKVLEAFDKVDNVLLFVQDTIGVEDFSKYGKAAYAYLSSVFDTNASSHLFLPRVSEAANACIDSLGRTRKALEINEAADVNRISSILKTSPRNLIIIRLKTAGSGRLDALMEKDERMRNFVSALSEKTDNFIAILTGDKPNPIDLKRPRREAGAARSVHLVGACIDVSAKVLKIVQGSTAEVASEKSKTIEVPDQEVKAFDEVCDEAADRSGTFEIETHDPKLTSLKLRFNFQKNGKRWQLPSLVADYQNDKGATESVELSTTQNIAQDMSRTYVAQNPVKFISKDKQFTLTFENFSANPYPKDAPAKSKVRATYQAGSNTTYFSIPILSALTVSLLFIIIMTWALENITSIKTMDQFDDPRGKTITVAVSE